jgi:F420-non-reducing hydrogenase small subunit
MAENGKPKFAMYWAASCGGCEIAVLNIGEHILDVDAVFEIAFWPAAADFKYDDVRGYPDGYIDLALFNGAIRNSENEEIAHLLRQKSKVLVAFGSCASSGGIPSLGNLSSNERLLHTVYLNNPSIDNPGQVLPQPLYHAPEGDLYLPELHRRVKSLSEVVEVDYTIPGCPPEPHQIWAVMQVVIGALQSGGPLPPRGAVIGAGQVAVCDECSLEKNEKMIERFYRPYEIKPNPDVCLLEQGLVCLGPATRSGCGALCPKVGMGCRGCYGPVDDIDDQGIRILSAISSVISIGKPGEPEHQIHTNVEEAVKTLVDPAGTFYRFGMAKSTLKRTRVPGNGSLRKGGA